MAISDKVRKILWGRSGSRCALCRRELIVAATANDDEAIVGDECHIVSREVRGPRYDPALDSALIDDLENLLLLCKTHHKQVDDQADTYTVEMLRLLKDNHEAWVAEKLQPEVDASRLKLRRVKGNEPACMLRITTGRELFGMVHGGCACKFDHEEVRDENEIEAISSFLQLLQDWGEIANEIDASGQVRAAASLAKALAELESLGFWVFGATEIQRLEGGGGPPSDWKLVMVSVLRSSNPTILSVPLSNPMEGDEPASAEPGDGGVTEPLDGGHAEPDAKAVQPPAPTDESGANSGR